MNRGRAVKLGVAGIAIVAVAILTQVMPHRVPAGTVLYGVLYGSLNGLLAVGLVLIYRMTRTINFAYGSMGALAASLGATLYLQDHWPWPVCILVALVVGGAVGLLVGILVEWRFSRSPRLVLTVATVGLSQLLGGLAIYVPKWLHRQLSVIPGFKTDLSGIHKEINPVFFTGNDLVIAVVVPILVAAVSWFLLRTDAGRCVRAVADNSDRARLLGVPTCRLMLGAWAISGVLAGLAVVLQAPSQGVPLDVTAGPTILLPALAAAVLARMESMPTAFFSAIGLGVLEYEIRLNVSQQSVETVVFLVVLVIALLFQRTSRDRGAEADESSWSVAEVVSPIPTVLKKLPEVVAAKWVVGVGLAVLALILPALLQPGRLDEVSVALVFGMVALSLVVLSGWGGVVSLGQVAIVGVGGIVAGDLMMHLNLDLFLALAVGGVAGAAVALVVGLPALRIKGLYLAVTTLAFAVAADEFFFNPGNFNTLMPSSVLRPVLWKRFSLQSEGDLYYLCLTFLVLAVVAIRGIRRARTGRVLLATRDNLRAAEAAAVPTTMVRLSAFMISGVLAGIAGGLYVVILGEASSGTFPSSDSLIVFSMTVIGGIGSVFGALAGVGLVQWLGIVYPNLEVLLTGVGVLVVLALFPAGLAGVFVRLRDAALVLVARRRGLDTSVWSEVGEPNAVSALPGDPRELDTQPVVTPLAAASGVVDRAALLTCRGVTASYGSLNVLFGVDLSVYDGEILALLGTNGAGKSTLLKALTGLLPAEEGSVFFDGEQVDGFTTESIVRRGMTMMPGGRGVFPSLTVGENLRVAGWRLRRDADAVREARQRIMAMFPVLAEREHTAAGSLSGGEQQMLSLAMAFLVRPRLLCIDELSLGLAPAVVSTLVDAVRQIRDQGTTVVIVEQSVNVALLLAERATFLEKGQVRFSGATGDLLDRPDLLRAVFIGSAPLAEPEEAAIESAAVADEAAASAAAEPVLQCRGLVKRYGGITAVNGVDLDIRPGEVVGLIGHNGAGKTSLFDLLSGFVRPDEGQIYLSGVDVTVFAAHERSIGGLGRSFQEARLFPTLTVAETIQVAMERHLDCRSCVAAVMQAPAITDSEARAAEETDRLISLLGLEAYRNRATGQLSTGTRRVVELACVLAHQPSVLLLDEPTSGVSQAETESLGPLLRRVAGETGCALVIIEHDMAMISSLCQRLVALELGAVIAQGSPDEVLAHPKVVASYLGTDADMVQRSGQSVAAVRARSEAEARRNVAAARAAAAVSISAQAPVATLDETDALNAHALSVELPSPSLSTNGNGGTMRPRPEGSWWERTQRAVGSVGWVPLLVLAGLGSVQGFDSTAFGVLAPEIRSTFHLDNAGLDTVTALTGAVPLLLSVFFGNLGDRGDRVRISRYCALLWGVTAVLTGVAPILLVLVIARLAGGVGMLASQTLYPSLLSDYYPAESQAEVFTIFLLASSVLGLISSPLDGWAGQAIGWRPAFVVLAIPTFIFVFLLRLLIDPGHHQSAQHTAKTNLTVRESFRRIRAIRTLRRTWFGAFFIGAGVTPIAVFVSTFFKDVYGIGPTDRGFIVGVVGVGGLLGLVLAGGIAQRLVDRGLRHLMPVVSGSAAAVLAVFAALSGLLPSMWLSILAICIAGFGVGGFLPAYITTVAMVTPSRLRSQSFAWSLVFFALGAILVSGFIGAIADSSGQRTAFVVLGLLVLIGSLFIASGARFAKKEMIDRNRP
ncbi:MAG TPA: MFS transporter [Acidimicrobiales bacterium]